MMTHRQKQCLLCYLGYYTGAIDGLWGSGSQSAAKQFQRENGLAEDADFGTESEAKILALIVSGETEEDWWNGIRHWKREEFRCRCGGKYCDGFPAEPQRKLVELADAVRSHFGSPGIPSSGLRCGKHNALCGGVKNSRHLCGKALDFRIQGRTALQTLAYVRSLPGVRYAYAIDGNYVHMDIE